MPLVTDTANNASAGTSGYDPMQTYFLTHAPAEWRNDPQAMAQFEAIYGPQEAALVKQWGVWSGAQRPEWQPTEDQRARYGEAGQFYNTAPEMLGQVPDSRGGMNLMPGQALPADQAGQYEMMMQYLHPELYPNKAPAGPPGPDPNDLTDRRNWLTFNSNGGSGSSPPSGRTANPLTLSGMISGTPPAGRENTPLVTTDPNGVNGLRYFNSTGGEYGSEDQSYWRDPVTGNWMQGQKDGTITQYGANPPWMARPNLQDNPPGSPPPDTTVPPGSPPPDTITPPGTTPPPGGIDLSQFQGLEPGALTLASLLTSQQPKSWLQPGAGYGDIGYGGTPTGRVSYWNEAGKPFQYGQDTRSYWYNVGNRDWQTGDLKGNVSQVDKLPWMQGPVLGQPWQTPSGQGGDLNYFNAQGQTYKPGDPNSYWFNKGSNQWETGDLGGNVGPAGALPWGPGGQNQTTKGLLNLAQLLNVKPPAKNAAGEVPPPGSASTGQWWNDPKLQDWWGKSGLNVPRGPNGEILPIGS